MIPLLRNDLLVKSDAAASYFARDDSLLVDRGLVLLQLEQRDHVSDSGLSLSSTRARWSSCESSSTPHCCWTS